MLLICLPRLLLRIQGSSQQWGGRFGASNRLFEPRANVTLVFQSWLIQVLQMLSANYLAFITAAAATTSNGISARLGEQCLSMGSRFSYRIAMAALS